MFDYYHYFAEKGNHPDEEAILALEKDVDLDLVRKQKDSMLRFIKEHAPKPTGVRIIIDGEVILHDLDASFDEEADRWLAREEKTVNETKHSSYYMFLHNIRTNIYDYMITDESYAICGGGFPLYADGILRGTFTVTGCRPDEDHRLVVDALKNESLL